ncbi:hypothetical protein L6452_39095 [Arctium lappa]|uniref:Uncharacterized protein n=1 Tax=Arctium lappa TaxID=4217 RepID=A0ACB8XRK0_ARCLA|nr:hypothetical protein L6452_39095 [Arctium lappa]
MIQIQVEIRFDVNARLDTMMFTDVISLLTVVDSYPVSEHMIILLIRVFSCCCSGKDNQSALTHPIYQEP